MAGGLAGAPGGGVGGGGGPWTLAGPPIDNQPNISISEPISAINYWPINEPLITHL